MQRVSVYEIAVLVGYGNFVELETKQLLLFYKDGQPITGFYIVYTLGEGIKTGEFLDFEYARNGCKQDGVFSISGPGAMLSVSASLSVKQISSSGCQLTNYSVVENSVAGLFARVKTVADRLLLKQKDRDLIIYFK